MDTNHEGSLVCNRCNRRCHATDPGGKCSTCYAHIINVNGRDALAWGIKYDQGDRDSNVPPHYECQHAEWADTREECWDDLEFIDALNAQCFREAEEEEARLSNEEPDYAD